MPEIRLLDVFKRFGKVSAISGVNLEIRNGEYMCVLGPTGSGKTTLLRLIAGLIEPDEGEILIDGKRVNKLPPEERDVAYMPQQYALFPHMSVQDNVAFGPISRGKSSAEASKTASDALKLVRLEGRNNAFPNELSGGMQQRVALARGIASGANLMLLDEPLGALDARLRMELRYHLKSMVKSQGLTAVHVTHDQKEAMVVADRIVVLRAGRCEQIGTPFHTYQHPDNLFVANFVGDTNFLEGTTSKSDSTGAFVELRGGLRVRIQEKSYMLGERVVLTIRQEMTVINPESTKEMNVLPGRIQAVRFLGSGLKIDVRLVNGDVVGAMIPLTDVQKYPKVNERITLTFKQSGINVFPAPPRGLAKEIEVI